MIIIIIKGSTHQVDIKILNVCLPDSRTSKYMQQKLTKLKGECFSQNIKNQKDSFSVATLEGRIEWSDGFKILRDTIYNF